MDGSIIVSLLKELARLSEVRARYKRSAPTGLNKSDAAISSSLAPPFYSHVTALSHHGW